jgi:hypothetical protein
MNGTADGIFSPDMNLSRAMLVTILWRMEDTSAAIGGKVFSDVMPGQWYSDAVAWASANSIISGYGDGRFGPDDYITREQLAAILFNFAHYKKMDTSVSDYSTAAYTDMDTVSDWARDAMKWANAKGLISGRSATTLAPLGYATRAEAAAILQRFLAIGANLAAA